MSRRDPEHERHGPVTCNECGAVRWYPDEPHDPECSQYPRKHPDGGYLAVERGVVVSLQSGEGPEVQKDLTRDYLRDRVSGEQMVHRLRDWTDGDTLYGVTSFSSSGAAMGKTYRDRGEYRDTAEQKAREHFKNGPAFGSFSGVMVLYRATVTDVWDEGTDPADPGEPPLKYATLTDVEILDWKQADVGDGDE